MLLKLDWIKHLFLDIMQVSPRKLDTQSGFSMKWKYDFRIEMEGLARWQLYSYRSSLSILKQLLTWARRQLGGVHSVSWTSGLWFFQWILFSFPAGVVEIEDMWVHVVESTGPIQNLVSETIGSIADSNSHAGFKISKEVALPLKIHTSHRLVNLVDEMFYGRVSGPRTCPIMEFFFLGSKNLKKSNYLCRDLLSLILQRNYNRLWLSFKIRAFVIVVVLQMVFACNCLPLLARQFCWHESCYYSKPSETSLFLIFHLLMLPPMLSKAPILDSIFPCFYHTSIFHFCYFSAHLMW